MITWWNDSSIEVVEIEGRMIALDGWNGEMYGNCFEVTDIQNGKAYEALDGTLKVFPIYSEDEEPEIIGYRYSNFTR